jgi:type VI secretion system protein VasJ
MADEEQKDSTAESAEELSEETEVAQADAAPEPLSPLLQSVLRPISDEHPCGADVTYDDDFQQVKAEIDRIGTVSVKVDQERAVADAQQLKGMTSRQLRELDKARQSGREIEAKSIVADTGSIDYAMIIDTATRILSEKSKDLRVVSYLCLAMTRAQGFAGFAEGLASVEGLIKEFWECLYPAATRMVARKNAIEFLVLRLTETVENAKVDTEDREPLDRIIQKLDDLQKELEARFPENPPSVLNLRKVVVECRKRVPEAAPGPTPAEPAPGPTPGPAASTVREAQPAGVPPADLRSQGDAFLSVSRAARFLRQSDPTSAAPYRLVRCMRWDSISVEPPHENRKTRIEPPPAQRCTYLRGLQQNEDWQKLVDEAEASFTQPPFHFWLDLQRLLADGMARLPGFENARNGILWELAYLLERLQALPTLSFSDGTPFADPATQDWIEESVMPLLSGGEGGSAGLCSGEGDSELDARFNEARQILNEGDLAGALALLQDGAALDNSRKARFRRRMYMATLCMRGNRPNMARPLLEDLSEEIEKYSIHEWEPPLALEVWTNLHKCYEFLAAGAQGAGSGFRESAERIFEKMCRLDVGFALAASGTKPKARPRSRRQQAPSEPAPQPEDTKQEGGSPEDAE